MPDPNPNPNPNPNPDPNPNPAPSPSLTTLIPQEYAEKPWAKQNASDPAKFFKWVDNLDTTVGKKGVIVPGENATPEEINAFHAALGRPQKAEEYEFENIPELKDVERKSDKDLEVKKLLHGIGVPKEMAKKLVAGYEGLVLKEVKAIEAQNKKLDEDFVASLTKTFGDKKDLAISNAKKLLQENVTPEVRAKLEQLDNNSLLVLTAALDGIVKKYVKEDGFTGGGTPPNSGGETYEVLSAKQRELMKNPAFTNYQHADHEKVMAENNAIMTKMRALKK